MTDSPTPKQSDDELYKQLYALAVLSHTRPAEDLPSIVNDFKLEIEKIFDPQENTQSQSVMGSDKIRSTGKVRNTDVPDITGFEEAMLGTKSGELESDELGAILDRLEIRSTFDEDDEGTYWIEGIEKAKTAIHRYAQRRVAEELKKIHTKEWAMPRGRLVIDSNEVVDRIAAIEEEMDK